MLNRTSHVGIIGADLPRWGGEKWVIFPNSKKILELISYK